MNETGARRRQTVFVYAGSEKKNKKLTDNSEPSGNGRRGREKSATAVYAYHPFRRVVFESFGCPRWPTGVMCAAKIPFATRTSDANDTRHRTRTPSHVDWRGSTTERDRTTGACVCARSPFGPPAMVGVGRSVVTTATATDRGRTALYSAAGTTVARAAAAIDVSTIDM